jgi:hypothetical protein
MRGWAIGVATFVALMAGVNSAPAAVRIADDRGGRIGTYLDKYESLRNSGETVVIDGTCASACTIVLGALPAERICVTPRASLGFHAAWDPGPSGRPVINPHATRMLYSLYPERIKSWIAQRGGLKQRMIFLRGRELASLYRPCLINASASSARQ